MDEMRLDELSEGLVCLVPREGLGGITSHERTNNMCDCEKLELIRLARLGLWAEKHAVPYLKRQCECEYEIPCPTCDVLKEMPK